VVERRLVYPVSAAILAMFAMFSLIWSQFYPFIMKTYSLDAVSPVALAASFSAAGNLLTQVLAGFIADRRGPKPTMAVAGLLYLAGTTIISMMFSHASWENARLYWYAGALTIGAGIGMYIGTLPVVISRWYPDAPGKAYGIALFGQYLSPVLISPLAAYLITSYGLKEAFTFLGAAIFTVIYIIGVGVWRTPPREMAATFANGGKTVSLKESIRDLRFWILFTVMFSTAIGWFLIMMNIATIVVEGLGKAGLDVEYVASSFVPLFMSVAAVGNALGAYFWGVVNDRMGGPLRTLPIVYALAGVMIFAFYLSYTSPSLILLTGCLLYFSLAGEPTVHFAAVPTFFGNEHVAKLTSILNTSVASSAIIGPFIGAFIRDVLGSYFFSLAIAAVLHFFAVGVVLAGRKYAGGGVNVQVREPEGV
jgi:MFS family permease